MKWFISVFTLLFVAPLFLLLIFLSEEGSAQNNQVLLTWDRGVESDLSGYKVYRGTSSGVYFTPVVLGIVTSYLYTGLPDVNYFIIKATNSSGQDSLPTPEQSASFNVVSPVISAINVTNITSTNATISWTTDIARDTRIRYGTNTSYGTKSTFVSNLVTSHNQQLTGLAANTTYHYQIFGRGSSGNLIISTDQIFTTLAASNAPPTVSITAPSNGASVMGTVVVSANAADDIGVLGVQFKLDGNNLGMEDITAPYSVSWDTTPLINGTAHILTAIARDGNGNSTTSSSISVTINQASLPSVPQTPTNFNTH